MDQTLGQWIARHREAKGLTQLELARRFDIDPGTCSRWERDILVPDASQLRALCQLFEASADAALSLPQKRKRAGGEARR